MYALQKRKAEWELKNEILLERFKAHVGSVLSFLLFVLWRMGEAAWGLVIFVFRRPKLYREVGPGVAPQEIGEQLRVRLHEQGPFIGVS